MLDHRSDLRVSTVVGGRIKLDQDDMILSCLVCDYSRGGARLVLCGVEALPDRIHIEIPRLEISTTATIVWRGEDVCGIAFEAPAEPAPGATRASMPATIAR